MSIRLVRPQDSKFKRWNIKSTYPGFQADDRHGKCIGRYKLNIWDVGGQQTIRAYWRNYFELTDGLIWVVDSADQRRLDDCKKELFDLLTQEKLAGASLLIFANKQDLAGALSLEEIAAFLELTSAQFKNRHWKIVGCSAMTGNGLAEGIDWIVRDISDRIFLLL